MTAPLSFSDPAPEPSIDYPKPERLIQGNPKRTTWNRYEANGVYMGEWACEPGAWHIEFGRDEHEFFQVIHGRCRVVDHEGQGKDFGPGDACMLGPGFSGSFEVFEPLLKRYMIVDRSEG
jgi:uncharacterized cupin superfamily protein